MQLAANRAFRAVAAQRVRPASRKLSVACRAQQDVLLRRYIGWRSLPSPAHHPANLLHVHGTAECVLLRGSLSALRALATL
jgi:hypothetical protein